MLWFYEYQLESGTARSGAPELTRGCSAARASQGTFPASFGTKAIVSRRLAQLHASLDRGEKVMLMFFNPCIRFADDHLQFGHVMMIILR